MKRPEGFDERPESAAPETGAPAPRQRRAPRPPRRAVPPTPDDGLEARLDPAPPAADAETDSTPGTSPRERAEAFAGTAGRRLGAGLSSVAGRLRAYAPDEDHATAHDESRPVADTAPRHDGARRPHGGANEHHELAEHDERAEHDDRDAGSATDARVTDVLETPIGARVRAAETAREARIAKRRRRLLERAEVRRFTRRSRHRRAAWITAAGIVVVLGASILVAVYSPLMALQTIEVKGTNRVDDAALRRALSGQIGTPLARLDFDEVKRDIAEFPLVESYVTEEAPPHTLVVTVTERTPVVAVRSGRSFDLVDPAGIVVQSAKARPATMPLADIGSAKLGSRVFRTMTEVVLALPSTVRSQTKAVAASTADDVTLTLQDGSKVVWGSPDSSDAKARLLAALVKDHEARNPGTVVEYDVSAPDNGVIRAAG
ncbi:FtsQ-type POTRA domain-containing protein [Curtobacterium sp. DN_7.5]|uniref:FtsQ-type POTRA domain-containing protein n=1 Tax=Curtobacterium sp. DN_7.5 TaxID=3049047 RepID=UPI001F5811E0|nr:FtsQ-type POTRA domain-containing protein [Curtobacterium sp. DN_7.5]